MALLASHSVAFNKILDTFNKVVQVGLDFLQVFRVCDQGFSQLVKCVFGGVGHCFEVCVGFSPPVD